MGITVDQFRDSLLKYGILTEAQLAGLPADVPDAESLARELVQQRFLTKFQALNVGQGRAKGLVFGEYVILDKIGEGGMGQVYKAQHRRMKRVVALKVLPARAVNSPKAVQRFYQEVEVAAKLSHPNIVTAHDAGEAHGMHFLAMEYVEGRDLSSYVKKHGPLGVEQAANVVLQAARGLAYAHGLGIIHRDIKPSNLLLDRRGCVKILDMGLARYDNPLADASAPASELTASGEVMGTVDYMAPEQAQDTRTADQRADIYALGCTLYRLLAGKPPYHGETMIQKIFAHREQPIPSLRALRGDVPEALDRLYQKMMAKSPADRTSSMDVVVATLEKLLSGVSEERSSVVLGEELAAVDEAGISSLQFGGSSNSLPTATPVAAATMGPAGSTSGGITVPIVKVAKPVKAERQGDWATSPTNAPAANRGSSRGLMIGGGVAAVVALGIAGWFAFRGDTESSAAPDATVAVLTAGQESAAASPTATPAANPAGDVAVRPAPPVAAASPAPSDAPSFLRLAKAPDQPKEKKQKTSATSALPAATPTMTAPPSTGAAPPAAVAAAASPSSTPNSPPAATPSSSPPATPSPSASASPLAVAKPADGRIDVLASIDTNRDVVSGAWKKHATPAGSVLLCARADADRIQMPVAPPAEYVLELVLLRSNVSENGILLGLVVGGRQCVLAIDNEGRTELGRLDDRPMFRPAEPPGEGATGLGQLKPSGESSVVECRVTPRRVTVLIDGVVALDWRGDNRRLSLDPEYRVPDGKKLFLGSCRGWFSITRFDLIPGTVSAKRRPVPSASEQREALAAVKERFRSEYAKSTRPDDKTALARTLFEQAASNADDAATRFALLTEARNFAAELVDFDLLSAVTESLSREFDVDQSTAAADGWEQVLVKPHPAPLHKQAAETALRQLEQAVLDERFAAGKRLSDAALAAARKANDTPLLKRATDRGRLFAEQAAQYEAMEAARTALEADDDDPAANLTLGRYLCFTRGDWLAGFERLAKGGDATFKALAEKSLAYPVETAERVALGDAWWNEAARSKDKAQGDLRNAAAYWYSMAVSELTGVEKVRIEQRLNEIAAATTLVAGGSAPRPVRPPPRASGAKPVDLLKLINPARDTVFSPKGPWTHRGTSLAMPVDSGPSNRLQIPVTAPAEYILTVTVSRMGSTRGPLVIGLVVGGTQCCLHVGGTPLRSGLGLVDGKPFDGNETTLDGARTVPIRPDRPMTIICSVRKTGLVVTADDKTIVDWKGDGRRLSLDKGWKVPNPAALFIGSQNGSFEFTKLELAPPID